MTRTIIRVKIKEVITRNHMKGYSSKEIIKILLNDGWYEYSSATGSHHSFKHKLKKGRVVVPHPKKDLPIGTVKSIAKQAQIKLK